MWLDPLLNLIFPPVCEACRQKSEKALCPQCLAEMRFMRPQLGVYSACVYEGVVREAIHRFKFKKRRTLAEALGITLVKYISQLPSFPIREIDYLVPVPLHPQRARQRGFNQAELLARTVGQYFEKPVVAALARVKNTHPQFDLPRDKRLVNIKGAFKVADSRLVFNKKLLLVDDIYTTGSTIAECGRVLRIAGARGVEVLTLARAVEI